MKERKEKPNIQKKYERPKRVNKANKHQIMIFNKTNRTKIDQNISIVVKEDKTW